MPHQNERTYLNLLEDVLRNGERRGDRTETGTISVFGRMVKYDLQESFPLLTTKKVWFRGLTQEMLWFLSGSDSIMPLIEEGVSIWTDWPAVAYFRESFGLGPDASTLEIKQAAAEHAQGPGLGKDAGWESAWDLACGRFEAALLSGDVPERYARLGPVYGVQWRDYTGLSRPAEAGENPAVVRVDQIERLMQGIEERPLSRRHIVDAWNPAETGQMALPPCHRSFQVSVREESRLDMLVDIRSNDLFLGHPFNAAQYALLCHMIAAQSGYEPGTLTISIGDAHIYSNHLAQVQEQLSRVPRKAPTLSLSGRPQSIFDYKYEDLQLQDYDPHSSIKAPVAV